MAFSFPSVADFKEYFYRDFPYATPATGSGGDETDMSKVQNADIEKAFTLAKANWNPSLFPDQNQFTVGFFLLSAHYMVMDLKASNQGLRSQFNWNRNQISVGGVQESFQIPPMIAESPWLSHLSKTQYGANYASLIVPLLVGNISLICGRSQP